MSNQIVIFCLHGLGGIAQLWETAVQELGELLSYNIKFILPQAPIIRFNFHETYRFPLFLRGWYNIESRSQLIEGEEECGLLDSVVALEQLIAAEIANGIPSSHIFLLGFSQGGSVVLSMAFLSQYQLGGIISLAGFLPYHKFLQKAEKNFNQTTPILMLHGEKDWVVPCEKGRESAELLQAKGYRVEFKVYPQADHVELSLNISDMAYSDIIAFLQQILSQKSIVPSTTDPVITIRLVKIAEKFSWWKSLGSFVCSPLTWPSILYYYFKKKKKTDPVTSPSREKD